LILFELLELWDLLELLEQYELLELWDLLERVADDHLNGNKAEIILVILVER
jgi:hypothetical protein